MLRDIFNERDQNLILQIPLSQIPLDDNLYSRYEKKMGTTLSGQHTSVLLLT